MIGLWITIYIFSSLAQLSWGRSAVCTVCNGYYICGVKGYDVPECVDGHPCGREQYRLCVKMIRRDPNGFLSGRNTTGPDNQKDQTRYRRSGADGDISGGLNGGLIETDFKGLAGMKYGIFGLGEKLDNDTVTRARKSVESVEDVIKSIILKNSPTSTYDLAKLQTDIEEQTTQALSDVRLMKVKLNISSCEDESKIENGNLNMPSITIIAVTDCNCRNRTFRSDEGELESTGKIFDYTYETRTSPGIWAESASIKSLASEGTPPEEPISTSFTQSTGIATGFPENNQTTAKIESTTGRNAAEWSTFKRSQLAQTIHIPQTTEQTTERQTTEQTTERQTTEQPTERQTTEQTTERQTTEQPTERQTTEQTTEPQRTEQTTERQTTERQTNEQTTERQTTEQTTERQTIEQTTGQTTERQTTEQTTERQTTTLGKSTDSSAPAGNDVIYSKSTEKPSTVATSASTNLESSSGTSQLRAPSQTTHQKPQTTTLQKFTYHTTTATSIKSDRTSTAFIITNAATTPSFETSQSVKPSETVSLPQTTQRQPTTVEKSTSNGTDIHDSKPPTQPSQTTFISAKVTTQSSLMTDQPTERLNRNEVLTTTSASVSASTAASVTVPKTSEEPTTKTNYNETTATTSPLIKSSTYESSTAGINTDGLPSSTPTSGTAAANTSPDITTVTLPSSTNRINETTATTAGLETRFGVKGQAFHCPGVGFFRDPNDCHSFYRCRREVVNCRKCHSRTWKLSRSRHTCRHGKWFSISFSKCVPAKPLDC